MKNSKKGFASMALEQIEKIARKGGIAAQNNGKAHKLTTLDREKGGVTRAQKADYHKLGKMGADIRWSLNIKDGE